MNRRIVTLFVLAALLIVPALALALPSPDTLGAQRETDPSKTSKVQVGSALSIPATGTPVTTPILTEGRIYEFDVSGTWQYDGNTLHQADMAFSTADGWSSASKVPGGRSLVIDGLKQSDTGVAYRASHNYTGISYTGDDRAINLSIFDNIYTDGNTGSLTVTIWAISKITWTITNAQPLPEQLDVSSGISVPPTPVPGITVPPTTIGGTSPIGLARIRTYRDSFPNGQPSWCAEITVAGAVIHVGCVADPARLGPNLDQGIGTSGLPSVTICETPPCAFAGVSPTPVPLTGGIKKGSSLVLTLSWTGDESKLWNYVTVNKTSLNQTSNGWAPFDPTADTGWFTTNALTLGASLGVCLKSPDGTCAHQQTVTAPGLGQFLQAMFHTQVNGI